MRTLLLTALLAVPALAQPAASGDVVSKLEELWKTRDDAASMKATDETISEGLKAFPDDFEILWRAARYRWWLADGATDEKFKKQIAKEGWLLAERAVKAKPDGMQGHYYVALNIGAYSQAVGILKALGEGLEGKFNDELEKARKADATFDRMGPINAKGRYWWELPWPKRDLGKSRAELKSVAEKHPEHLRAWLYLAETELKDGNAKEAKTYIDKVTGGADGYDPPEARRMKKWARPIAEAIDNALK
ncbi:MAG: hypothetical protein MUC96_31965 [Myxococcaceae bacterium]|jgi:hypothetical protein|nr:hypothetical protein [Myxococcaceae bacterium]